MKKNYQKSGQTLVEALVALGILATIFTVAFSLINLSSKATRASKKKMMAISYAQDALEKIRNIRDTNLANNVDFGEGIAAAGETRVVKIEDSTDPYQNFALTTPLITDSTYQEKEGFSRFTNVTRSLSDEIFVEVQVSWEPDAKFKVSEILTNWKM